MLQTANTTPIVSESVAATLLAAMTALHELGEVWPKETRGDDVARAEVVARMHSLADVAGDVIFAVLNHAKSFGGDAELHAAAAIESWLKR